jgi:hypothetical protein
MACSTLARQQARRHWAEKMTPRRWQLRLDGRLRGTSSTMLAGVHGSYSSDPTVAFPGVVTRNGDLHGEEERCEARSARRGRHGGAALRLTDEEEQWRSVSKEQWWLGPVLKLNGERRFSATCGRMVSYGRRCGGSYRGEWQW